MRKKRLRKRADSKGQIVFGVGLVVIAAFGFLLFELNQSVVERNESTLCRKDGYVARETAIVIDATDNFSKTQAILVKKELDALLKSSVLDERITLYVLGEKIVEDTERLSVCNPGDGSQKSELTSNKRRLREQWEESFYLRLSDEVDNLIGENRADWSPILEMLKLVSINTMYDSEAAEKRIIFVSDMLHHTKEFSHYEKRPDYESFKETAYHLEQKPHLSDVDLTIFYIVRPRDINLQNRGHVRFWESLTTSNGGRISRVKTIN